HTARLILTPISSAFATPAVIIFMLALCVRRWVRTKSGIRLSLEFRGSPVSTCIARTPARPGLAHLAHAGWFCRFRNTHADLAVPWPTTSQRIHCNELTWGKQ